MKLSQFLDNLGQVVAYYPALAPLLGGARATVFFCQLFYWTQDDDGWIKRDAAQIEKATGLDRPDQTAARTALCELGVIEATRLGSPPTYYYRVNRARLNEIWESRAAILEARLEANRSRTEKATQARAEKRAAGEESNLPQSKVQTHVERKFETHVERKFKLSSDEITNSRESTIHSDDPRQYIHERKNKREIENKEKKDLPAGAGDRAKHRADSPAGTDWMETYKRIFDEEYTQQWGGPYVFLDARDLTAFEALRQTYDESLTEEIWRQACQNYIQSPPPISGHKVWDLIGKFAMYLNGRTNDYGRPVKKNNGSDKQTSRLSHVGAEGGDPTNDLGGDVKWRVNIT